jgi:hypothetical protein
MVETPIAGELVALACPDHELALAAIGDLARDRILEKAVLQAFDDKPFKPVEGFADLTVGNALRRRRCLACGNGHYAHDALLPHGIEPTGHAWLHSRCWPAWHAERKAGAVSALKAIGITPPAGFPHDFGKNGGV